MFRVTFAGKTNSFLTHSTAVLDHDIRNCRAAYQELSSPTQWNSLSTSRVFFMIWKRSNSKLDLPKWCTVAFHYHNSFAVSMKCTYIAAIFYSQSILIGYIYVTFVMWGNNASPVFLFFFFRHVSIQSHKLQLWAESRSLGRNNWDQGFTLCSCKFMPLSHDTWNCRANDYPKIYNPSLSWFAQQHCVQTSIVFLLQEHAFNRDRSKPVEVQLFFEGFLLFLFV